jgi:hypothetical protein
MRATSAFWFLIQGPGPPFRHFFCWLSHHVGYLHHHFNQIGTICFGAKSMLIIILMS